ncbi:MAG: PAS domain S-box protein [Promethearchaeota archaeon]
MAILESLEDKKIIVEGSKFTRQDVLSNPNRNKIYYFIKKNPGVYFNIILKKLNINKQSLKWHLRVLLKFKFIRKQKIDGIEAYFDREEKIGQAEVFHFISREKCKTIIQALIINDNGITQTRLSRTLKIHPKTIKKYLKILEEDEIIIKEKVNNRNYYFLNAKNYNGLINKVGLAKLKRLEEKYRPIFDNVNDFIAIINEKYEYEYINEPAFISKLGYISEDMLGKARYDLIHPDDLEHGIKVLREGFKTGKGSTEGRFKKKDGSYIWLGVKGRLFIDESGNKKGIIVAWDINKQKKKEDFNNLNRKTDAVKLFHDILS